MHDCVSGHALRPTLIKFNSPFTDDADLTREQISTPLDSDREEDDDHDDELRHNPFGFY